jgi:hypothetical protein
VLGHLIESERRGFAGRIRLILAGAEPNLEGWDQGEVARARRDCERPAAGLVAELDALRRTASLWSPVYAWPTWAAGDSTRRSATYG